MRETHSVWIGEDVWDLVKRRAHEDRVTVRTWLERAVCVYVARHPVAPWVSVTLKSEPATAEEIAAYQEAARKDPPRPAPVDAAAVAELTYDPEAE